MTESNTQPIKTPFYQYHVDAGAKMVDFCGFMMPVQYTGITEEHLAVRENVGLFDLSHMGEFIVSGPDALAFLQKMTTNNVAALEIGQIQYSCMPYPDGGIVDDLLVYRTGAEEFFLVVNASNIVKDYEWLESHVEGNMTLENDSDDYGLLAIQGPNAQRVLAELTDHNLDHMPYYSHATAKIAGEEIFFSRTGYTGEDGFEMYIPPAQCQKLWKAIMEAGSKLNMKLIGLGARDTLRLEMKMSLYGNDIDKTTTPIEAGLGWIVSFEKDFVGRSVIEKQKEDKPKRRLVCLEMEGRLVPRHGMDVVEGDQVVGQVTSGTFSPSLQKSIALAYVPSAKSKLGSTVEIAIRNKRVTATVVKPPFYKKASHR